MITIITGVYGTIIPLVTRFIESLYREVCLMHQKLPEGWTTGLVRALSQCENISVKSTG